MWMLAAYSHLAPGTECTFLSWNGWTHAVGMVMMTAP